MAKLNFQQPLLQSSVSHDPSEIILVSSHITLQPKTGCPLKVEPGQYLDGRPPGKTRFTVGRSASETSRGAHPAVCVGPNAPL